MPIVTIRPNSTIVNGGGTSTVPSGTRHAVTSDNNLTTYVLFTIPAGGVPPTPSMDLGLTNIAALGGDRILHYRVRDLARRHNAAAPPVSARILFVVEGAANSQLDYTTMSLLDEGHPGPWVTPGSLVGAAKINNAFFRARLFTSGGGQDPATPTWRIDEAFVDLDVRSRMVLSGLAVFDAADVDQCAGTVTDTTTPRFSVDSTYGYQAAPNTNVSTRRNYRVFTPAQTAVAGFDPWTVGPWGPPVWEHVDQVNRSAQGDTQTAAGNAIATGPFENGTFELFVRFGTLDFLNQTGSPWWSNTVTCSWTQDVPVPDPPSIDCTPVACPPSVVVDVTHDSGSTVPWDDPAAVRTQIQVSHDGGVTWTDVLSPDNGRFVAENETETVTDRFVQVSYAAGEGCDPSPVTRELIYRARLYGFINDPDSIPVSTDWAQCPPVTVSRCDQLTNQCDWWIIHPADPDLDWSGTPETWPWSTIRPYAPTQPITGGIPTVVSGRPGGRNHQMRWVTRSVTDEQDLRAVLAAPVVWLIPAVPDLPAIWAAPGPDTSTEPGFVPTNQGAVHLVQSPMVETGPPPIELPPPGP